MGRRGAIADLHDAQKELKENVADFFAIHNDPDDLVTPADAALFLGITTRTLWNYRNKMDAYANDTCDLADDYSFKTVIDGLYTRLESRIIKWMAQDPGKRATAAAIILNKHFGYKDEGSHSTNNFNGPTQIKVEIPPEMKALAQ